jgi:hypothetical protein
MDNNVHQIHCDYCNVLKSEDHLKFIKMDSGKLRAVCNSCLNKEEDKISKELMRQEKNSVKEFEDLFK